MKMDYISCITLQRFLSLSTITGDIYRQIEKDLLLWKDGITRDLLEIADKRATHYQIIDHKVYREKKCIFEPRYLRSKQFYGTE